METGEEAFSPFSQVIELVGKAVDAAGVLVIVLGVLVATIFFFMHIRRGHIVEDPYKTYRHGIGRALLLGLEVLVAADIIRTVAIDPSFQDIGILAGIALIRTFLSWSLEVELEGRWPWQAHNHSEAGARQRLGTDEQTYRWTTG